MDVVLIILIILLVLIVLYILAVYNSLVSLKNKEKEAFSTMDVYLKKRWDLIPNLVETVKGYTTHEKDLLNSIVESRNKMYNQLSNKEKISDYNSTKDDIKNVFVLAEAYPELKASENFINLSKELVSIEEDIANSRKYYNAVIRLFNNKVEKFPSNIVANVFGYKVMDMFIASDEEKKNTKIEFTNNM